MRKKLRGFKRSAFELDFDLYRKSVPIPGLIGSRLSVIDLQPEAVQRTIMLLHGYAGCAETWEHQLNHFSRFFRVVAPDLRGHGQSDAPYSRYTMQEIVTDLYTITQNLAFPEKFILVGHSFGGSICVEYAIAHPEQIERLVLIATAGQYPLPRVVSLFYRLPATFFRPWWKYRPRWNAEIHVLKRMMRNNMSKWIGWPLLERINVPTMVITGERDNYFPRAVYDDVGQHIPGAEVVDIGASKHKVQLERAEAVNRAIERFADESKQRGTWRSWATTTGFGERRPWLDAYSQGTPPTIPIPRQPLHRFLESSADWLPKQKAIIFFDERLTYEHLNRLANQFAHVLYGRGIQPGDRVMLVLPNIPDFVVAYYGTLKAGAVAVLSNLDADAKQIVFEARQTQARILVTLPEFAAMAEAVNKEGGVEGVIFAGLTDSVPASVRRQLLAHWRSAAGEKEAAKPEEIGIPLAELLLDAPYEAAPAVDISSQDLAAILYTSGTTDNPKGVTLTHANLVANAVQTRHWVPDLRYGKERVLAAVPLQHSYGMTGAMNLSILVAATMVMLPDFDVQHVLDHVKKHRPTIFPGVPSMFAAINRAPGARTYGLASIRACISGSAPLPVEVQETFEKLTHGRLVEGYGLTEASPVTHANPLDQGRRTGSMGVPLPNTDAKIVDLATGDDLPPGQIGALWVKGPQVMSGYWDKPEETAEVMADGWLDTGDVAVMDVDGYFHYIGRTRDVIRAGEHTVYPRDVEELLYEHNKVHEVAVVGVPRASANQKVKAYVVPRPGVELSAEELLALCQRRLEPYAVPWEIEFRDSLPRSFVGKVIRRMLVE